MTATVKEGGTDVTADYTVKYKVNENEAAAEPPSLIDAGSYTVVVTAERTGYATLTSTVTVEIEAPATSPEPMPAITVTGDGTFPYDGKAHAVTATVENGEGYTVFYSTDGGKNWTTVAPSLTEPGKLTIPGQGDQIRRGRRAHGGVRHAGGDRQADAHGRGRPVPV